MVSVVGVALAAKAETTGVEAEFDAQTESALSKTAVKVVALKSMSEIWFLTT